MESDTQMTRRQESRPERVHQRRVAAPPVDIFENAHELLLVADMPGVRQDRINIRFEKNQLMLEGEFEPGEPENGLELKPFTYSRSFVLPGGIDADKISAELQNGVLQVHLPKHDHLRPRQISVKAA
jgi:HSP20 family molecular chaperone IbpA